VPYVVTTSGPHRGDVIGLGWPEPSRGVVALVRYVGWLAGLALVRYVGWLAGLALVRYGGYRYATRS